MSEDAAPRAAPIPADQVDFLIGTAARAPSVHNTQPWRFRVGELAIDLYADPRRLALPGARNCCCNWASPSPPAPPRGGHQPI